MAWLAAHTCDSGQAGMTRAVYSQACILAEVDRFLAAHPGGVIEILGPTASGKTRFSIELAKRIGRAEIISVDSRQVYRDIDISSAKITLSQMQGIPHHGIGIIDPDQDFSVYDFQQYAFAAIRSIHARGCVPILSGGTMLWLDAVSEHYIFSDSVGNKSTVRGVPLWPFLKIGMHIDRAVLYERINARAVEQFGSGLVEETERVLKKYAITRSAFTSFGYREIQAYLRGEITLASAIAANQQRNRNYAKRQLTWWRRRTDVLWMEG